MKTRELFAWIVIVLLAFTLIFDARSDGGNGREPARPTLLSRVVKWVSWWNLMPVQGEQPADDCPPCEDREIHTLAGQEFLQANQPPQRRIGADGHPIVDLEHGW